VAELDAKANRDGIAALAIETNRYCFAACMPILIVLGLSGKQLLRLWLGAKLELLLSGVARHWSM
jgi:hypothetical protein